MIIKTQNLSKKFGSTTALNNVSIEVDKGRILGLLGPNGAGKTTFIKALVGGIKPSSGSVEVFGKNPLKDKGSLCHKFGYMPQDLALYGDLSAYENVRFFAKLHNKQIDESEINELLGFLGILDRKNDKVEGFSGGMERRVSLAAALIHQPEVLILDEPTAGLDPSLKRSLWQLFRGLTKEGKTLLVSTHLIEEALFCDSLAIIRSGKIIKVDSPANIISEGEINISLGFSDQEDKSVRLPAKPEDIAAYLHKFGLEKSVERVDIERDSLEDIIIKIMEDQ